MRIIYYSPHPLLNLSDRAGYGTHMREMIKAFEALGHEVLPVIMGGMKRDGEETGSAAFSPGKRALRKIVPGIVWRSLKDARLLRFDRSAEASLAKQIEQFKPDLVYERANYLQVSGIRAARKYGVRHFLEMNAPYVDETAEFEGAGTFYQKKALAFEREQLLGTNRVLVVSSALRDHFLKKVSDLDAGKVKVVPNCVDPEKVRPDSALALSIVKRYGLEGSLVIGFVGSIFPYHGVDLLIEAFRRLYEKQKNLKLLIVGDGITVPALKAFVKGKEMEKAVVFTGSVPHEEVFSYIDVMDITVLANTKWYCSPIKIFEYGALGKAIVAPDMTCIRDVMENRKDGLLIERDSGALAAALAELLEDKEARARMASHFREKVAASFSWLEGAKRTLENAF
jgi:glycosyltransferase involved in cell wall biosynthesis